MPRIEEKKPLIDWSLTTWEGSRREQLRRWAKLSLREIMLAQEEMRELMGTCRLFPGRGRRLKPPKASLFSLGEWSVLNFPPRPPRPLRPPR